MRPNGAFKIGRCVSRRAVRGEAPGQQLQREQVIRSFADDNAQMPRCCLGIVELEDDEAEKVSRVEIVRVRGDLTFEVRPCVRVLARLDQLARPAHARVGSGDLPISRTERAQPCNRREDP